MDYETWTQAVDRLLQTRRPAIKLEDLDFGATRLAFENGMSPLEFIEQPELTLKIQPDHDTASPRKLRKFGPALAGLCAAIAILLILSSGRIWSAFHPPTEPKLVTVQELLDHKGSYNGMRVRVIGYCVDTWLRSPRERASLSDLSPSEYDRRLMAKLISSLSTTPSPPSLVLLGKPEDLMLGDRVQMDGVFSAKREALLIDTSKKLGHVDPKVKDDDSPSVTALASNALK